MSPFLRVRPVDPLNHAVPIVDRGGRPTPQFIRQWVLARTVNVTTDDVAVGLDELRELVTAAETLLTELQSALTAVEDVVGDLEAGSVPSSRRVDTVAPLSGGGDLSANLSISLDDSGVAAGVYGSATHVPQITVDAKGRITSVTEVAI